MVKDRFLKYVSFDTQSDPHSGTTPSTEKQKRLGEYLVEELKGLGVDNAHMDEWGYVYARLDGNVKDAQTVGFLAHMDTSFDFSGKDIKPRIIEDYDGKDIKLNENMISTVETFPFLETLKGKTLIVTDGTTLLGADDKAGVAEIMTLVDYLVNNDVKRGDVAICFTPDEEIGEGTIKFDFDKFNADFAYTVDGGEVGGIDFENFNAASADVTITGASIHPGSSKNKMVNAINIAMEYHNLLDYTMRPEHTEAYEGFYHIHDISGDVSETKFSYIIRHHDDDIFKDQKEQMIKARDFINQKYNKELVHVDVEDSYYNMASFFKGKEFIIEIAEEAIKEAGLNPFSLPIRGGTDGARLTYDGLPCPNLGTGGYNYHGPYELVVVEQMHESVEILKNIVKIIGER